MEDQYKIDPLTNERFVPKRINQKFATLADRIKYYNTKATKLNQERAYFNGPCKKSHNFSELLEIYGLTGTDAFG